MKATREKALETALVLTIACVLLSRFLESNSLLFTGCLVGLSSLLIPAVGRIIDWAWRKLAHIIGMVTNTLLLSLVYVAVLLPLALLSKAFGKLSIRLKRSDTTYFRERDFTYTKESLEKMW